MSKSRFFCGGSVLAVTLAATLGVAPSFAFAQPPAEEATEVEEIISTGTFIRGTAEDTAINVEVLGRDELLQRGSPSTEDILRGLSEIGNLQGGFARGSNADGLGITAVNLRSIGSGRTLATLNGRRLADDPTSAGATGAAGFITGGANQNINTVPTAALQQVEVLKDGGGATYGSDAVGGVVNFITRRDLNGMEVNAAYKYVPGSDGDYDASILWGRRNDSGNVLLSFEYAHISSLPAIEGNDLLLPFQQNGQSTLLGTYSPFVNVGTFVFSTATGTISPTGAGVNAYQGGLNSPAFPAIGGQGTAGSLSGALRDDACLSYGGRRVFTTVTATITQATPGCAVEVARLNNAYDATETFKFFGDVNLDLTNNLRYHGEYLGTKFVTRLYSGVEDFTLTPPCEPYPANAPSQAGAAPRACTPALGASNAYQVAGYNPAVRDYVLKYYTNPLAGSAQRVFTDAQIASLTGLTVGGVATAEAAAAYAANGNRLAVGQGYTAPGFGRVSLTNWAPFVYGPNPGFASGTAPARQENNTFRTTQQLRGDLGEVLGNQVDFDASITYQYNLTRFLDQGLLADRLQRALNGFATNLDDLGDDGLGCTSIETAGTRTIGGSPVTGVPYTVGAGGGAGDAANGFDAGAAAGNRCFFFNPFASAYERSRINGAALTASATDVGFVGGTAPGALDYQGYAAGYGLANAPGIVKWLYRSRENRQQNDTVIANLVFNGSVLDFELPGGPIAWAAGGEYRYVHRTAGTSALNDNRVNPCTFLSRDSQGEQALGNNLNPTSTCASQTGLFADSSATGAQDGSRSATSYKQTVSHALFAEVSLPILERVNSQFALRYEETAQYDGQFVGALVGSGNIKWQVNDLLALRVSAAESFDTPNLGEYDETLTRAGSTNAALYTNIANADLNPNNRNISIVNTNLAPEKGFSYGVGAIFTSPERNFTASLDYFYNYISGRGATISGTDIARALQGLGSAQATLSRDTVIDCSNPTVQTLFNEVQPQIQRTVAQYVNSAGEVVNSGCIAGGTIRGVDVNGNGVYSDAVDLGLSLSYLNAVSGSTQKVEGLEASVNYRLPNEIYGGNLAVGGDVTVNLRNTVSGVNAFGVPISDSTQNIGILIASFLQHSIFRGSVQATYARGNHSFSAQAQFVGGFADNATTTFGGAVTPGSPINNLNPANPADCNALNLATQPVPIPVAYTQSLNPILVGDAPYNAACNLPIYQGIKSPTSFIVNTTYRVQLPHDTTLNVTVDNLLDTRGAFLRAPLSYSGFSGVSPAGRTIKVGIQKKFGLPAQSE